MLWKQMGEIGPLRFAEEGGGGGGAGGQGGPDIEATVRKILSEKDSNQAVYDLLKDNFQQREELRSLKGQLEELPGEDAVVLTKAEAETWKRYQELGKPDEIQSGLKERDDLKVQVETHERNERIAEAAAAHGFNAKALRDMPGVAELTFEVREETVDGDKAKVAYVTGPEDGARPVKLTDHAEAEWSHLMGALEATDEDEAPRGRESETRFPRQSPKGKRQEGGPAKKEDIVEKKRGSSVYAGRM